MVRFEDWQKYLDEQIQEAHRRRKEQQSATEDEAPRPDPVMQDVRAVLLGGEKDVKKEKEGAPPEQGSFSGGDSGLEKTPFPFRFVNPSMIILQKDKGSEDHFHKEEKVASIEDPVTILTQKDKKSRAVIPVKESQIAPTHTLENLYTARQIELPLEGLPPEKETKLRSFMEKREHLLRGLLDPKITLEESALILAVPKETVLQFVDEKLISCHRSAGSHIYFKLSDVLSFLEDRQDILKIKPHEVEKILDEQDDLEG